MASVSTNAVDVGFSSNRGTTGSPLEIALNLSLPSSLSLFLSVCWLASYANRLCLPARENKTKTRERKRGGDEREVRATRKQSFSPLPFPFDRPRRCPPFLLLLLSFQQLLLLYATSTTPCNIYEIGDLSPTTKSFLLPRSLHSIPGSSSRGVVSRIPSKTRDTSASGLHYHRQPC